jgi:hypothetical protein
MYYMVYNSTYIVVQLHTIQYGIQLYENTQQLYSSSTYSMYCCYVAVDLVQVLLAWLLKGLTPFLTGYLLIATWYYYFVE